MRLHSKWAFVFIPLIVQLFSISSFAGGFVICNTELPLTEGDVKDIFTGEKLHAGPFRLMVVDNKAALPNFLTGVFGGIEKGKYEIIWAKKSFREGVTVPTTLNSDQETLNYVENISGGVGYVNATPGSGVKVLKKY
jgi:hypothetical protein